MSEREKFESWWNKNKICSALNFRNKEDVRCGWRACEEHSAAASPQPQVKGQCIKRKDCEIEAHEGCYGAMPTCYAESNQKFVPEPQDKGEILQYLEMTIGAIVGSGSITAIGYVRKAIEILRRGEQSQSAAASPQPQAKGQEDIKEANFLLETIFEVGNQCSQDEFLEFVNGRWWGMLQKYFKEV